MKCLFVTPSGQHILITEAAANLPVREWSEAIAGMDYVGHGMFSCPTLHIPAPSIIIAEGYSRREGSVRRVVFLRPARLNLDPMTVMLATPEEDRERYFNSPCIMDYLTLKQAPEVPIYRGNEKAVCPCSTRLFPDQLFKIVAV